VVYPRELLVATIYQVAAPALLAMPATAAQKSHADALPHGPTFDAGAEPVDHTHGFVPWYPRPIDRKHALNCPGVGMADAASLDAYADRAGLRID
jgi:hypothetical protein